MPINPTPPLVGGNSAVSQILQGYVFQSGIHKPEYSNILTYKYPQYYTTALLDKLGASSGIGQDEWSWNILDRTRESNAVTTNMSATGSTTITFETTWDYTSTKPGYLLVGDVIRLQSGALGEVTAVGDANTLASLGGTAGKQGVTVRKVGGGNWGAADIAVSDVFGHSHSMFAEGSSAPGYRVYLPTEESNALTILRRSLKITGSEFTNRTTVGDGSAWYFTVEDIEMKEFAKDREMAVVFGKYESDSSLLEKSTRGLWDYVSTYGVYNEFASAAGVSETDIQDHIKELMIQGSSDSMTVLAGADFMTDFQRAMKDYVVNGGVDYGRFGNQMVGLDVTVYKFLGKTIYLKYYELFDDTAILPFVGTPTTGSTGDVNFSNTSLWLDLGSDSSGHPLVSLKHKELDGVSRKFIHAYEDGMVSATGATGGKVANGDDAFKVHYLSEIGVEVRLANRMGILRAGS